MPASPQARSLATACCDLSKSYRSFSVAYGKVGKLFNNGNGCLDLFRFIPETKSIRVNDALATKADLRKLRQFMKDQGLTEWKIEHDRLNYPNYYFRGL